MFFLPSQAQADDAEGKQTRAYTDRNQLANVAVDSQNIGAFQYDAGGRETSRTLGNGASQTRTYRSDGLLSAITTQGDVASSPTYGYDANKNLTSETFGGGATASYSATMAQDAKDRLTSQSRSNGDNQAWTLTKEGNWASATANGVTETRTHNDNHQISAIAGSLVAVPTYDAQGNLQTDEQARVYSWDQEKNLTGIVGAGTNVGFAYDAMGRRVSKTSNSVTTTYVSSGSQEIQEYQATTATKTYVHGTYVDEVLVQQEGSGTKLYPVSDRRYSTVALLDSTGAAVERYAYDAYGKTTVLDGAGLVKTTAPLTEILWTGRRLDDTGNYYFRSRYFNTVLGRFISRDVDYLDGANLYAGHFAAMLAMDPSGKTTRGDIKNGRLQYSCNCGWIDWGHALPGAAEGLKKKISNADKGVKSISRDGHKVYFSEQMGAAGLTITIGDNYFVKSGLGQEAQKSVALTIFKEVSEKFETEQGALFLSSSFSEEDLVSNLIGFYRTFEGYSKDDIKSFCKMASIKESEQVWDATGGLGKNREWEPINHNDKGCGCKNKDGSVLPMNFPEKFKTINPAIKGAAGDVDNWNVQLLGGVRKNPVDETDNTILPI